MKLPATLHKLLDCIARIINLTYDNLWANSIIDILSYCSKSEINAQYGFEILEHAALLPLNNTEAFQYFSALFPSILLKSSEVILSVCSTESKKAALKCLDAWITFVPSQLNADFMNLLIKALCEFALLEEAASCISKYLEFSSNKPNDLYEFVKAVVNYLAQESVREIVRGNANLAGTVKEISENYTPILNKVLYCFEIVGRR